jgi:hypothetical protein
MAMKTPQSPAVKSSDAINLLVADHQAARALFKEFETLAAKGTPAQKKALVEMICNELSTHERVEKDLFYPAARAAIGDDVLVDEAEGAHAGTLDLISQLRTMHPGDEFYDAKVKGLSVHSNHHATLEEEVMFSQAREAGMETEALGLLIAARRLELNAA